MWRPRQWTSADRQEGRLDKGSGVLPAAQRSSNAVFHWPHGSRVSLSQGGVGINKAWYLRTTGSYPEVLPGPLGFFIMVREGLFTFC